MHKIMHVMMFRNDDHITDSVQSYHHRSFYKLYKNQNYNKNTATMIQCN